MTGRPTADGTKIETEAGCSGNPEAADGRPWSGDMAPYGADALGRQPLQQRLRQATMYALTNSQHSQ